MENIHSDVSMERVNPTETIIFAIIISTTCNYFV